MRTTIHPKVEVVSCFRSTGSMPVPKPVTMILPAYTPHRPRNKRKVMEEALERKELIFKHADTEETCDIIYETVDIITELKCQENIEITVIEHYLSALAKVTEVKVLSCDPEPLKPPPLKKKEAQSCKKHSRCHCDLLSLDTNEFFSIKV